MILGQCYRMGDDSGRWVYSPEGFLPLPGGGDPTLETHRVALEQTPDREARLVAAFAGSPIAGNPVDTVYVPYVERVAARRHCRVPVEHGCWTWVVWETDVGQRLAERKIEWHPQTLADAYPRRPLPSFARAPFVRAPNPRAPRI